MWVCLKLLQCCRWMLSSWESLKLQWLRNYLALLLRFLLNLRICVLQLLHILNYLRQGLIFRLWIEFVLWSLHWFLVNHHALLIANLFKSVYKFCLTIHSDCTTTHLISHQNSLRLFILGHKFDICLRFQ